MPEFKAVLSNPKDGTSKLLALTADQSSALLGLKIGETLEGERIGAAGMKVKITGGSDKSGFPMRPDLQGGVKRRILVSSGPGFKPSEQGERVKRMMRGNTITDDIVQVNLRIVEPDAGKAEAK